MIERRYTTGTVDGFTIAREGDSWEVRVTRNGVCYAWAHTFTTRDYARQCCAAAAPWPIAWAEVEGGKLIGLRDEEVGA